MSRRVRPSAGSNAGERGASHLRGPPGRAALGWYSVVAQTGTPPAILAKVSAEVVKAVKEPQFGELLKSLGLEIVGSTRAELDAFRRDQTNRIGELVKASGGNVK